MKSEMKMTKGQDTVPEFLEAVDRELRSVPKDRRNEVIADLAEHVDEARELGRSDTQILASLGTAKAVASDVLGEFQDGALEAGDRRILRILGIVALAAGVLAAVVDTWLYPSLGVEDLWPEWMPNSTINYDYGTTFGAGLMLVFLVPGVLVAAGSILKGRLVSVYRVLIAVIVTVLPFLMGFNFGIFFLPLIVSAWMIAGVHVVPGVRRRTRSRPVLRVCAGVVAGLPAAALLAGLASGTVAVGAAGIAALLVLTMATVGAIRGWRLAYWTLAASGAALLVASVFDMGMLVAALWVAGTIYFFVGLAGLLWDRSASSA